MLITDLEEAKKKYKLLLNNLIEINKELLAFIESVYNNTNDVSYRFDNYLHNIFNNIDRLDELNWKNKSKMQLEEKGDGNGKK